METKAHIGDTIRIDKVQDETKMFASGIDKQAREMNGKTGVVEYIDGAGHLWGTWGGMSVLPEDEYTVIKRANES